MIFQDPWLASNCASPSSFQMKETLRIHGTDDSEGSERRARALSLLEQVEIPDAAARLDAFPHQLSGGMAQRVMIAMAIACNPRLLIADEPTTALDVTVQAQVLALLTRLQRERNMALILITHDLALVAETAHRVVVMYAGQEVETGPVPGVFETPRHPYTQALLAALPEHNEDNERLSPSPAWFRPARPPHRLPAVAALHLCGRALPARHPPMPAARIAACGATSRWTPPDAHGRLATGSGVRGKRGMTAAAPPQARTAPPRGAAKPLQRQAWGAIDRHASRSARVDAALPRVARDVPAQGAGARARRRLVHIERRRDAGGGRRIRLRQVDACPAGDDDRAPDVRAAAAGRAGCRHGGCGVAQAAAAAGADGVPESLSRR